MAFLDPTACITCQGQGFRGLLGPIGCGLMKRPCKTCSGSEAVGGEVRNLAGDLLCPIHHFQQNLTVLEIQDLVGRSAKLKHREYDLILGEKVLSDPLARPLKNSAADSLATLVLVRRQLPKASFEWALSQGFNFSGARLTRTGDGPVTALSGASYETGVHRWLLRRLNDCSQSLDVGICGASMSLDVDPYCQREAECAYFKQPPSQPPQRMAMGPGMGGDAGGFAHLWHVDAANLRSRGIPTAWAYPKQQRSMTAFAYYHRLEVELDCDARAVTFWGSINAQAPAKLIGNMTNLPVGPLHLFVTLRVKGVCWEVLN